jgi:hypothetical protein
MISFFSFMKPLLTHSYPPLTATLPTCLLPITKLLTTKEQRTWVSWFLFLINILRMLRLGIIWNILVLLKTWFSSCWLFFSFK